jgi:hypothetical protein
MLLEIIPMTIQLLRFMCIASMDWSIGLGPVRTVESL